MSLRSCGLAVVAGLVIAGGAHDAVADESGDVAAARRLGMEGVTLADQGNCREALDKLDRSEKLHHAVSILEKLGECQIQLGKLVDGTENLRRAVREQLPPDAPEVFVSAQERAKQLLSEARPKIARLKIAVAAPADAKVWVSIDGVSIPLANLNEDRLVDPGEHDVKAGAPGFIEVDAKTHLAEGGVDSVALTLQPDPNVRPAPPQGAAAPLGVSDSEAPHARNHTAAYVLGAVGIVGLGLGTAFGVAAANDKSTLESTCPNRSCPASAQSTLDSGTRSGTISTVAFVIGGVALATGVTLFFVDFGGGSGSGKGTGAYVGPGSVGVAGSF